MKIRVRVIKLYKKLAIKSPVIPITVVLIITLFSVYFVSNTYIDTFGVINANVKDDKVMVADVGQDLYDKISVSSKILWYTDKTKSIYEGQVIKLHSKDYIIYMKAVSGEAELQKQRSVTVEIQTGKENIMKKLFKSGR